MRDSDLVRTVVQDEINSALVATERVESEQHVTGDHDERDRRVRDLEYPKVMGSSLEIHTTCNMRSPVRNERCVICALLGKVEPEARRVQASKPRKSRGDR